MKKTNWLAVALIAIVVILIMFWIGTFVGGWGSGGYGMMGNWGYRGGGMMGNWGYSPFGWFGMGLGMLFMWLIPLGIIALVIYGVALLVRNAGKNPSATPCPNCGKFIQSDWKNCPYCGTALK